MDAINTGELAKLNAMLSGLNLDERLDWAHRTYRDGLVIVTSFGPSGIVILDHMVKIRPDIHIITLDTQFLFPETYEQITAIRQAYPTVHLEIVRPPQSPQQQAIQYGEELWKSDPDLCCFLRKVEPLANALADKTAWINGVRRDQSRTRKPTAFIQWDNRNDIVKLSPAADWSEREVWNYIQQHNLPYNRLHDQHYPSIGCVQCTRAVQPGEDMRAGRWDGVKKTECGIHVDTSNNGRHKH